MSAGELWGYIIGGLGALSIVVTLARGMKGDTSVQATWMGKVDAKLDSISSEINKLGNVLERVALLERDVKTLFRYHDESKEARKS